MLSVALASAGDHERRVWHLVAYLGRYGKQPASTTLKMTMSDLKKLSTAVADLVREEQPEHD